MLCSTTNTSEKYERTQQGNLLVKMYLFKLKQYFRELFVLENLRLDYA